MGDHPPVKNTEPPAGVEPTKEPRYCSAPGCRLNPNTPAGALAPVPRYALEDTELCAWHHARFAHTLKTLAIRWPDLEHALYRRASGRASERVHTSGITDISSSWNPNVTEIMADIRDWTSAAVLLVLNWKPVPAPDIRTDEITDEEGNLTAINTTTSTYAHGITVDTTTRIALAALAEHHARWLSGLPEGPDYLVHVEGLLAAADKAIKTPSVHRLELSGATCQSPEVLEDGTIAICGAQMVFIERDVLTPGKLVCSAHPNTHRSWAPTDFMQWALK